jgi:Lrp/AsnC family transcriptional regulator, leucine-responsive regulatory protein
MPIQLDDIDLEILRVLQKDGKRQNLSLAQDVGLSASPCLRRVKRLEEQGVIRGYAAMINPAAVGVHAIAFVRVTLDRQDTGTVDRFGAQLLKMPEILECYMLSGEFDFLLKVATADATQFQNFMMNQLSRIPGVRNVKTDIPLATIKRTAELPF